MNKENFSAPGSVARAARPAAIGATEFIDGLARIAESYDVFLIDQWGVLHDGRRPYPGAADCLRRLAAAGKQVVVISNSGKRSAANVRRMKELGIGPDCYTELVTSGEVAWRMLADGEGCFSGLRGKRCLLLSSDDSAEFADGFAAQVVHDIDAAEFIFLAGIDDAQSPAFYDAILLAGVRRGIPLICANPDYQRLTPQGLKPSAGALAERYRAAGGRVSIIGKPRPEIYAHCLSLPGLLRIGPTARVLAIGDSLHHDIVGGAAAGLDSLLILGGIHVQEFAAATDTATRRGVMLRLAEEASATPHWAMPYFCWGAPGRA